MSAKSPSEPAPTCALCPRLTTFRAAHRAEYPGWHNAPVPSFGSADARILIVGLAPGLKGANRTGRPFTGDYAGDLLYATLLQTGLAAGTYAADPTDGLRLIDCRITNAVRCVPPENKPTPSEIATCRSHLVATISEMPHLRSILALGRVAHDSVLTSLGRRKAAHPFGHGRHHDLGNGRTLVDSYHCSRYNTNTGVLTTAMFKAVITGLRASIA